MSHSSFLRAIFLSTAIVSILGGCALEADDAATPENVEEARQALDLALAPPGSQQHDEVMIAFRADLEEDGVSWIRVKTDRGDPVAYECGASTCTCYNTADCLVMVWDKTDGPCSDTGPGTTCCIRESCT